MSITISRCVPVDALACDCSPDGYHLSCHNPEWQVILKVWLERARQSRILQKHKQASIVVSTYGFDDKSFRGRGGSVCLELPSANERRN